MQDTEAHAISLKRSLAKLNLTYVNVLDERSVGKAGSRVPFMRLSQITSALFNVSVCAKMTKKICEKIALIPLNKTGLVKTDSV